MTTTDKDPRTREQKDESNEYISINIPRWRRKENNRLSKEKKQNVQSTFWNTGGHEAEQMAELEQLQEMTRELGNFTFQIHCTTYTPTQWKMKFAVLFTFTIKIHFLRVQMCTCPFWNRVWTHFLTLRLPPSYHHRGFYMSKSPLEQFKQLGSLLPCFWPFIFWSNYLSRILTAHQELKLLVKQFQ